MEKGSFKRRRFHHFLVVPKTKGHWPEWRNSYSLPVPSPTKRSNVTAGGAACSCRGWGGRTAASWRPAWTPGWRPCRWSGSGSSWSSPATGRNWHGSIISRLLLVFSTFIMMLQVVGTSKGNIYFVWKLSHRMYQYKKYLLGFWAAIAAL